MPLFCEICNNLLVSISSADTFYFKCLKCQEMYKPTDIDTMIYEEIKGPNLTSFKTILQNAGKDPVNQKVYRNCKKCNNNIAKQIRLGKDMKLINICVKCNKQWIEGTEN